MATNVTQFTAELLREREVVPREFVKLRRRQALTFVELVATDMPVDTGHAQANILVSRLGPDETENFDEPLSVREIVNRARAVLRTLRPFDPIFVNFNAPYMSFLNDGSSTQAPAGFIETAAMTADLLVR